MAEQNFLTEGLGMGDPAFKAVCGGKDSKPKPWANTPGGRLTYRGRKILAAQRALLPETLDLMRQGAEGFGNLYRTEAAKTRADELEGFEKFGPRYVSAINAADPVRARTRDIILGNLDEGLDPAMQREVQQGSRAAYTSRGLAQSPGSAVEELMNLGTAGRNLQSRNLAEAMQFTRGTDPFLAYAGRPSTPQGSNIMGPDYGSYSGDIPSFQANQELQSWNAHQASLNRKNQLIAAGISSVGSIAGGAAGFI